MQKILNNLIVIDFDPMKSIYRSAHRKSIVGRIRGRPEFFKCAIHDSARRQEYRTLVLLKIS